MHNKGGAPVAFVEYADVRCAAQALISLQGTYLLSSDRGGVRIEYARNKMAETGGAGTGGSNNGGSPTSGGSSSSSLLSSMGNGQPQEPKYNLHHQAEVEAAKMSNNQANMNAMAAAAAANSALSQAVQGAPLHALGLYGHHIWLGEYIYTHPACLMIMIINKKRFSGGGGGRRRFLLADDPSFFVALPQLVSEINVPANR